MDRMWGYLGALAVALLFGVWFTLDKILLNYLHPFVLAAMTYLIATVFLFIIYFSPLYPRVLKILHGDTNVETSISKKEYGILILIALFGSVIAPSINLTGLNQITAVNAALLANTEVLFVILIGIFFLKETVVRKDVLGFACLLIGTIFLSTNNFQNLTLTSNIYGNILVVVAAFFWSLDASLSKFLSNKRDIIYITALECAIGGSVLLVISLSMGLNFRLPLNLIPLLLFIGVICLSFSLVLSYFAIREIGSTRTGSIYALSSLFGAVIAFSVLKEPFTIYQLFFGILMLIGVLILYKNQK
ncbi:MAG: DMT family transporter [Methanothermobacter sp.]|jgi:drug/metabolite transporter (DMT)-like permease